MVISCRFVHARFCGEFLHQLRGRYARYPMHGAVKCYQENT